jgi:hypothetical protein
MKNTDWARALPASSSDLGLSRRGQLGALFSAFVTFAFLREARAYADVRVSAAQWVDRQEELARALMSGEITPLSWMQSVRSLAAEVDLQELLALVNRSDLRPAPQGASNDPAKRYVRFIDSSGAPRRLTYGAALFDFTPGNVITPHGHRHMVSAHLVARGAFRIRNFDRVGDEPGLMLIRPTRDFIAPTGSLSAMSSLQDNIHWFVPHNGAATTFDVVISDLDPGQPSYEIQAIDPLNGQHRPGGVIAAPIIGFGEASRRYTADV